MNRRTFLRRTTPPALLAIAGCTAPSGGSDGSNGGERDDESVTGTPPIPILDDPPKAVYLPGHRKSMRVLEPAEGGEYTLTPMLSYPHPFWVVTANYREFVEPDAGRGVHLMLVVWDRETGRVLPGVEPTVTIERNGREIVAGSLWPMLSQEMGVHFGDNVDLPADGTYAVDVDLPPFATRRTGSLAGRFEDAATASFEFTYDEQFRETVVEGVELLDQNRWGQRGALEPMTDDEGSDGEAGGDGSGADQEIPYSRVPPAGEYPGTLLVEPTTGSGTGAAADDPPRSGDAAIVATLFEPGTRPVEGEERYLLVSSRTPYNRVPLAYASLRAVLERDGQQIRNERLEAAVDSDYGVHYGLSVDDVRQGDFVRIVVESPPQTARHQGYETAFFGMEPVEFVVPSL